MSALPPKADMDQSGCDVRFVPKADINLARVVVATNLHSYEISPDLPQGDPTNPPNSLCGSPDKY